MPAENWKTESQRASRQCYRSYGVLELRKAKPLPRLELHPLGTILSIQSLLSMQSSLPTNCIASHPSLLKSGDYTQIASGNAILAVSRANVKLSAQILSFLFADHPGAISLGRSNREAKCVNSTESAFVGTYLTLHASRAIPKGSTPEYHWGDLGS